MTLKDIVSYCLLCNEYSIETVLVESDVFYRVQTLIYPMPIELPVMGVVFKAIKSD